jgi:hypothetical protein
LLDVPAAAAARFPVGVREPRVLVIVSLLLLPDPREKVRFPAVGVLEPRKLLIGTSLVVVGLGS